MYGNVVDSHVLVVASCNQKGIKNKLTLKYMFSGKTFSRDYKRKKIRPSIKKYSFIYYFFLLNYVVGLMVYRL